jgi:glycosyltransferase involved in cell wall biosynthesis
MRLTYLSASGQLGGAETALVDIVASIREAEPSWPVQVVIASDGPLAARMSALGAETTVLPFPESIARLGEHGAGRRRGGYARFAAQLGLAAAPIAQFTRQLSRAIDAFSPDLVHSNGLKLHVLAARAGLHAPLVWHVHDFVGGRRVTRGLLRWTRSRVAAIVANSRCVAGEVRAAIGDGIPVTAIHNAVDLVRFAPEGPRADLDRMAGLPPADVGTVRVGLVATFARWKGHEVFLRAIAQQPAVPPIRAYVIGGAVYQTDGSQYTLDELRRTAADLGVADRVGFTGFVDRSDSVYRALDIVVHASTAPEPFGLVIAEAMACGRAVVVSNAGGAAEIVTADVDALTHVPGDADSLAAAIRALAIDPSRRARLGRAARVTAEHAFDRARLARELLAVYDAAVAVRA